MAERPKAIEFLAPEAFTVMQRLCNPQNPVQVRIGAPLDRNMSSLIELEEPFRSRWRKGYLQIHPSGRKYICLYNSEVDRTIISYGRYLLSVKVGALLGPEVEADHRDDDPTNDNPDNIQGLSALDNVRKGHLKSRGFIQSDLDQTCVICNGSFRLKKVRATCGTADCKKEHSRRTSLKIGSCPPVKNDHITPEKKIEIKELSERGISLRKIQDKVGVNRTTVSKILREW